MDEMADSEAIAKLTAAMLSVQTVGEMHALIIDYTYVEIMEVYNQLAPEQQARIVTLCDRDTQEQITATRTTSVYITH